MSHNASGCNQSDRSGKGGGHGARGPRRVPRPLVVRHRRDSPLAVGNVARGGPGPGRRHPAAAHALAPTRRLARPPPQRSLTHARRAPRPTTPSAAGYSAVATTRVSGAPDCGCVRAAPRRRSILFVPRHLPAVPTPAAARTAAP